MKHINTLYLASTGLDALSLILLSMGTQSVLLKIFSFSIVFLGLISILWTLSYNKGCINIHLSPKFSRQKRCISLILLFLTIVLILFNNIMIQPYALIMLYCTSLSGHLECIICNTIKENINEADE